MQLYPVFAQHLPEQVDIGFLVVDDQDAGVEHLGLGNHRACSVPAARAGVDCECFIATSSVSMKCSTLMGLVM